MKRVLKNFWHSFGTITLGKGAIFDKNAGIF